MTEQTSPSRRAGLRDEIAAAIWERQNPGRRYADCEHPWQADAEADADAVLPVLYRAWPWLRAEAEEATVPPEPDTDQTALRDRIAEALADALKPRYGGPQHNTPGGLPLTATAEEIRLHRAQPLADAVLSVLPARADRTAVYAEVAEMVRCMAPEHPKNAAWVQDCHHIADRIDEAVVVRRATDETPGEAEPTESVIYEVVGDWGVDSADSAEGARAAVSKWLRAYPKCGAYAQQRIVREWPDGSEFYGPWTDIPAAEPAVGAQQPKEET